MDKWIKKLAKLGAKLTSKDSAFKNNKAAFSKLVNVTLAQKEEVSIIKQSGDIDNGAANPQVNPAKEVSPRRRKIKKEKKDNPQKEIQENGTKRNGNSAQHSGNLGTGTVTSGDQEAAGSGEQGEEKENSPAPEQAENIETQPSPEATADAGMEGQGENESLQQPDNTGTGTPNFVQRDAEACPYCNSKDFVKRGTRKNKLQVVQLYLCKNEECGRTFSAQDVKGKHFPLNIIIEGMSYYNLGFTLEQSCSFLQQKFNIRPGPETDSGLHEIHTGLDHDAMDDAFVSLTRRIRRFVYAV